MMTVSSSSLKTPQVKKPYVHEAVCKKTVYTLADRLFRKHLALQYVSAGHPFLETECHLISDSVKELRVQLRGITPIHDVIAGIHLTVLAAAEAAVMSSEVSDVDEDTLAAAYKGVEGDSFKLLAQLSMPEC